MKTPLIQLSLAGARRLVHLNTATVRIAYHQFANVNPGYVRRIARSFDPSDIILYQLWNSSDDRVFDRKEIRLIESELNRQVVDNNLLLVENESRLFDGQTNEIDVCKSSVPNSYIFRCGMAFSVEPMTKSKLVSMKNLDLFWQDGELHSHYVRYCGLLASHRQQQFQLLFRYPLDLSKTWIYPLADFHPRQMLMIRAVRPCKGFYLK